MTFFRAYYAYAFLLDFIFAYAIYTAFFEFNGLSHADIGSLLAVWAGSALVFEIATGTISDRFDRRTLLIVAPILKAVTFVLWAIADGSFALYALGFGCWSLAGSLFSGTGEALLYERTVAAGLEDEFEAIYGRASAAESLGIAGGYLFGGIVAGVWSMEHAVIWSLPPLGLASICAILLRDQREGDRSQRGSLADQFRFAIDDFRNNRDLRVIALYIAGALITFDALEEFDQLFYTAVDLPLAWFGVAGTVGLLVRAIANIYAHRLAGKKWISWAALAVGGVSFIIAAKLQTVWAIAILEFGYLVAFVPHVLAQARLQRLVESDARATTTSVVAFLQNITGMVFMFGFGILADRLGILPSYSWAGIALLMIAVGLVFCPVSLSEPNDPL